MKPLKPLKPLEPYIDAARERSERDFQTEHASAVLLFEVERKTQGKFTIRAGTITDRVPTLLVIDDDSECRDLLQRAFRNEFRILHAANGQEGIETALRVDPDVIICDQRMPGLTGNQVLIRLTQLVPDAIRVLATAFSDYETLVEGINIAKIHHYVEKPIDPDQLKSAVDSLVRARGASPDAGGFSGRIATQELRPPADYRVVELIKPEDSLWSEEPICFGRSSRNDIVVKDQSVSNRHAHFSPVDRLIWLSDLESRNGTSVNGQRLKPRRPLRLNCGDELCFGRVWVRFHQPLGFYDFLRRLPN